MEQAFVALLCLAWSEANATLLSVTRWPAERLKAFWGDQMNLWPARGWTAKLQLPWMASPVTIESCFVDYLEKRVHRSSALNATTLADDGAHPLSQRGLTLIIGGFAWGLPSRSGLNATLGLLGARWPHLIRRRTLLVELLPQHFPGGHWLGFFQPYPSAEPAGAACDARARGVTNTTLAEWYDPPFSHYFHMDALPAFNRMLVDVAAHHHMHLGVLPVASLYADRGDAHIGAHVGRDMSGRWRDARDCLHYCVAPGVLDALARALLGRVS